MIIEVWLIGTALLSSGSIGAAAGQESLGNDIHAMDPDQQRIFVGWDADGDGKVAGPELNKFGSIAPSFDENKDGVLTAREFQGYFDRRDGITRNWSGSPDSVPRPAAERPLAAQGAPKSKVVHTSGGTAAAGNYTCFGYGLNAGGGRGFVRKGSFVLQSGGRYSANGTSGTYRSGGGKVSFHGGAYDGVPGELKVRGDGKPQIVLTWPATGSGGRSSTQYCSSSQQRP